MAESLLHRLLKLRVSNDLEREGYRVFPEPLFPPDQAVDWFAYRPDLFAVRVRSDGDDYALVECETNPNMYRFRSKNFASLCFQPKICQLDNLRKILAVPTGKLRAVDLRLRDGWEIWVVGRWAATLKVPLLHQGVQWSTPSKVHSPLERI